MGDTARKARLPKRALVIAPQPFFSPRGTPFSVYYRTLVTAEEGVEVDLLTYGEGQDVAIRGVRIIRIPRFAILGPVRIGPSLLKLFLDGFLVLWTLALLIRRRYDFVHAHEESVFFCRLFKPIFGFKLVYDMHSSLPQQLANFMYTKSKLLSGLFHRNELAALRDSDAVITICPDLAQYALGLISDKEKHFLIENSIFDPVQLKDPDGTGDRNDKVAHSPPGPPRGRRIIVYAGTLEPYQGIDLLLESFGDVRRSISNAFLLIVGGQPQQVAAYQDKASQMSLADDCLFTGRVPQTRAKHYCSLASVQVSSRISGTNTPLKIYEQLANGIPLVATNIYSHTQVLNEQVAFLVEPERTALAAGLVEALTDTAASAARVRAAQKLYAERYSRRIYVSKMRRLLEKLA